MIPYIEIGYVNNLKLFDNNLYINLRTLNYLF